MTPSTSEERRVEQRRLARRAILDATETLLVERGYEGFSMRRLVDRCGYTAPTIYHHFGDKPRLLDALLEERFTDIASELERVAPSDDPVDHLRRLAVTMVRIVRRNPTHYRLLSLPREQEVGVPPSAERAIALVQSPLRQLQRENRLATPDVESAFQAIWATLHGLLHLRIVRPRYAWAPDVEQVAIEALLRGLVSAKASG